MNLRKCRRTRPTNEMVSQTRNKCAKRKRSWKNSDMKRAIEMVSSAGCTQSEAARRYNIPLSTLALYLKQRSVADLNKSDAQVTQMSDWESMRQISDSLSDVISDNDIETISVSSSNTDHSNEQKFVLVARKSTCPYKLIIKNKSSQNKPNICADFTNLKERELRDEFYQRDHMTDTQLFIDSLLLNNEQTNLIEFEKPVKIYSYLALRQRYNPIFLNKNLKYLGTQINVTKKKLKIDEILDKKNLFGSEQQVSFKLESILIHTNINNDFILYDSNKDIFNESISIDFCVTNAKECIVVKKFQSQDIQVLSQNGSLTINFLNSQFIPLNVELYLSQNFKYLSIYVKILEQNFDFIYSLLDINDFSKNSPKSSPLKENFYQFSFRQKSDEPFKPFNSIHNLIDSFNKSNLVQTKLRVYRYGQTIEKQLGHQKLKSISSNLIYQFVDKNNKKFTTRSDSLYCLFCYLDSFMDYSSLVNHITNCHFRLYVKKNILPNGVNALKLQLGLEDNFDGSYSGSLHDLIKNSHLGYTRSRVQPTRQLSIDSTEILVNRRSFKLNLKSLAKSKNLTCDEIDALGKIQQQLITVSNSIDQAAQQKINFMQRVYYHTKTNQPVHIDELDYDSDSETDLDWLKDLTALLMSDFADVNEGEKEIMKLWSLHCLKFNYVADSQIFTACQLFIDLHTEILIENNLINNFILHLINLSDHNLLKRNCLIKLIDYLYSKIGKTNI